MNTHNMDKWKTDSKYATTMYEGRNMVIESWNIEAGGQR